MSSKIADKPVGKPRGKPFAKGNPGRPQGARNKSSVALETILFGKAEEIMNKVTELALQGNPMALRLCVERILGSPSERRIRIDLPDLRSSTDAAPVLVALLEKVTTGEITPSEGELVSGFVEKTIPHLKEREGFEKRLEEVTEALKKTKPEGEDKHWLSEQLKPFLEAIEET